MLIDREVKNGNLGRRWAGGGGDTVPGLAIGEPGTYLCLLSNSCGEGQFFFFAVSCFQNPKGGEIFLDFVVFRDHRTQAKLNIVH